MENKSVTIELTPEQYAFLEKWQKTHESELGIEVPIAAMVRKAVDMAMKSGSAKSEERTTREDRGDRPERSFGDRPRPAGRPSFGSRPAGRPSFGSRPSGDRPFGDRPRPAGRSFGGDRPERAPRAPREEGNFGDSGGSSGSRSFSRAPTGGRSFGGGKSFDRPSSDRGGFKPRTSGDRPSFTAGRPAGRPSMSRGPKSDMIADKKKTVKTFDKE